MPKGSNRVTKGMEIHKPWRVVPCNQMFRVYDAKHKVKTIASDEPTANQITMIPELIDILTELAEKIDSYMCDEDAMHLRLIVKQALGKLSG